MTQSFLFSVYLVVLCFLKLSQSIRTNCKEVDDVKKRRECFEAGQTVTFLPGGYYFCCYNLTHEQLVSIGASAFWTPNVGFCGRGACEACSKKQECVVFSDEDIFCCPKGYWRYQLNLERERKKKEKEEKERKENGMRENEKKDMEKKREQGLIGNGENKKQVEDVSSSRERKKSKDEDDARKKLEGEEMKDIEKEGEDENEDDLLEDT